MLISSSVFFFFFGRAFLGSARLEGARASRAWGYAGNPGSPVLVAYWTPFPRPCLAAPPERTPLGDGGQRAEPPTADIHVLHTHIHTLTHAGRFPIACALTRDTLESDGARASFRVPPSTFHSTQLPLISKKLAPSPSARLIDGLLRRPPPRFFLAASPSRRSGPFPPPSPKGFAASAAPLQRGIARRRRQQRGEDSA